MDIILREFRKMPFCWQDKPILRQINSNVSRKELSQIRNLYLTLTEIASNQNTEEVGLYLFDIANISGLSEPTVQKGLEILKSLGIVDFEPQQRGQDGKFLKKEIRLLNGGETVTNLQKRGKKVEKKLKPQLSDIIESNIEDNIENKNKIIKLNNPTDYYLFIRDFINIENNQIRFLINKDGEEIYFNKQSQEIDKLIKDGYNLETIKTVLAYIRQDEFWNKNILTIGKLRNKNKDGIPYIVVMLEKIKERKPKAVDLDAYLQNGH